MHTNNRFFDDIARVVTGAAGAARGVRADMETALRLRMERIAQDLDLAAREEVEALRALVAKNTAELEALRQRVSVLEAETGAGSGEKAAPEGRSSG